VTETPAPFAAGVHLPWADVPERVRRWAEEIGGGAATAVRDLRGGFSPGSASRLTFDGRDLFVKAVGLDLNAESPRMHRREAEISAGLPRAPVFPRLLASYDDGDWVALAFEAVDGRLPTLPWSAADLATTVNALVAMHQELTPSPLASLEGASVRLEPMFGGWERLAADSSVADGLDDWSHRHLDRLVELESTWPEACVGETLLHLDIRSDNLLFGPDGVVVVDWPHAALGPPILDVVAWAPSVCLEGGPPPEELLAQHGDWRRAEPELVMVLVAAVAGFFVQGSLQPAPPGLPTLRQFQAAQGEVALAWLQRLSGW
jgi:hypothetical protein